MGLAMALRLIEGGRRVVVRDIRPEAEASALAAGATAAPDCATLAAALRPADRRSGRCRAMRGRAVRGSWRARRAACRFHRDGVLDDRAGRRGVDRRAPGSPGRAVHRCADVRRPGARARRHDEPDGGVRRRGVRAPRTGAARLVVAPGEAGSNASATVRAPSSSTTCSPRSTWPPLPKRWRWPSGWAWTRGARCRCSSNRARKAGSAATACRVRSRATSSRVPTPACSPRTPRWRWRWPTTRACSPCSARRPGSCLRAPAPRVWRRSTMRAC